MVKEREYLGHLLKKQKELSKLKTNYGSLQLKYKRTLKSLQRRKKASRESKETSETIEREISEELMQNEGISTPRTFKSNS